MARRTKSSAEFMVWFDDVFASLVWRAQHPLTIAAVSQGSQVRNLQLEPPLYQILKIVGERGEMRISDLGALLGVTTATASRHAATLVERGFMDREEDPNDGRAVIVRLSVSGADALRRMRETWQHLLQDLIGGWPEAERRQLGEGMQRLADSLAGFHAQIARSRTRTP